LVGIVASGIQSAMQSLLQTTVAAAIFGLAASKRKSQSDGESSTANSKPFQASDSG
jgi:hypothetical protein